MAEADDWQPVSAGIDDWQPVKPARPETVPDAFLDRLRRGQAIDRVLGETLKGAQEGFGSEPIAGTDQHLEHLLHRLSIERTDPTSKASPLQFDMVTAGVLGMKSPAVAPVRGLAMLADIAMRGINAGVFGAGGAIGQLVDEAGGEGSKARKEAINFGNFLMIEGGMGRFSRPHPRMGDEVVGGLPKAEDFKTAAEIVHDPASQAPLMSADEIYAAAANLPHYKENMPIVREVTEIADAVRVGTPFEEAVQGKSVEAIETIGGDKLFKRLAKDWKIERDNEFVEGEERAVDYVLRDAAGRVKARASLGIEGNTATLADINLVDRNGDAMPTERARNLLGPSVVRSMLREFQKDYPDVTKINADRVSGARVGGEFDVNKGEEISVALRANTEQHLRDLWEERGIHPAEALHDAQSDAFLRQEITRPFSKTVIDIGADKYRARVNADGGIEITHKNDIPLRDLPLDQMLETSQMPRSLGAAASPLDALRPAYERAKDRFGRVFISDLIRESGASKETVHAMLTEEAAAGRAQLSGYNLAPSKLTPEQLAGSIVDGGDRYTNVEFLEPEGRPGSLGAAAPEPVPDLATLPVSPPGRLVAAARGAVADTLGLARNVQFLLDPMSTGSAEAMVIAKDAMNSVRRIDWEWSRRDQYIVDNFNREQRKRMWDAADEESVALQLGESREHQGLVTLEPSERLNVELDHAHAQNAWLHAVDAGLVEGEGLPAYTPRMVINIANAMDKDGPVALNATGQNVFTRTAQMRHRKYMTAEETEAAAKAINPEAELVRDIRVLPMATARLEKAVAWREMINHIEETGKAAGDETISVGEIPQGSPHKWFTVDNPAFKRVRPRFETVDGKRVPMKDADGEIVFDRVPIYVRDDFKGPLLSIFDEAPSKHPAAEMSADAYQFLMALKGKSMTVIMNSPLIHFAVVWGKVVPAAPMEWLGARLYFTGYRIKNDPARAAELIERGLAPIGRRGSFQDISSVAEEPNLKPGRSFTSDVLAFIPGLFKEEAGVAVKEAVDKIGDFVHNTLLWNRVEDVQFGLAQHLSDGLVRAGSERIVADRIAAHFSNMIVGSIPKEAMSGAARATANMLMFSRSFTLGNLQTFKTATVGLPKPILAQIMRDMGSTAAEMEGVLGAGGDYLKGVMRRRAMGTAARTALGIIAIDYVISKAINSVIQSSVNVAVTDSTFSDEFHGYARRMRELADQIKMDPFTLMHPLDMVEKLTPMSENEPSKANRIFIGYDKDGTALYGRNPMGKYPEEMVDWMTGPLDIMRRKMSPLAGGIYEIMANDRGFGLKIHDPTAKSYGDQLMNMILIGRHMVEKHLPMDQLTGAVDLIGGALGKDTGDQRANALRTFAPVAGFTVSHGAPGGMAKGEVYSEMDSYQAKFAIEWPAIRKQFQRGEVEEAHKALAALGVSPRDQRSLERSALNPGRIGGQTLQNFLRRATPEQIDRFDRARERTP